MTANDCTFTPDTLTMNGTTYPAGYSVPPHGDGSVFAFVRVGEKQIRIRIAPDDPRHAAALAAAQGYTASVAAPANGVIIAETHIDLTCKPTPEPTPADAPRQAEQPAEHPETISHPDIRRGNIKESVAWWPLIFGAGSASCRA